MSVHKDRPLEPALRAGQSVKLIGLGGVGSIAARYASVFLAALARLGGGHTRLVLIDGDTFEPRNATRMLFARAGNKAAVLRDELVERFAESALTIDAIEEFVTADNVARLVHDGDIVLLAVDNHATRKLVSDFCSGEGGGSGLANVCLISAGNDGIGRDSSGRARRGTFGNCQIHLRRGGEELAPSLARHHPEIRDPTDRSPAEKDCVEILETVPQNLFANLTAAATMLNTLWLHLCGGDALHYGEIVFDIADGLMRPVPRALPKQSGDRRDEPGGPCTAAS